MDSHAVGRVVRLGVDGRVLDDRYHGIGRVTYEIMERLLAQPGWHITLFVGAGQRTHRFDLTTLRDHPNLDIVRFDPALPSVSQFLAWPKALRRAGVEVALFPYHLGASLVGRPPRYSIVHDCIFETTPRFAPDARTRTLYLLLTKIVVRRTRVLTVSRASAAALHEHYRIDVPDSRVVTWGVGSAFSAPSGHVAEVNGTPLPARYYLHVGARRPHKNVEQLVAVLARLDPDVYLVLVGSPDPRWPDTAADRARELGVADRIVELSDVSEHDLLGIYRQAQGFLFPSLVEGFGLPLLEAMAAGVPVVASDIPVFRELVAGAALLVPVDDTEAWVRAIHQLDAAEARKSLVAAGYARAAAASWDATTARISAILSAG